MLDWNVYAESRISKINSPFLRTCALLIRNIADIILWIRGSYRNRDPYRSLVAEKYAETITLALSYVRLAAVSGDIAEFGTHGVTARIITKYLRFHRLKIPLHLFDSFAGFPEPEFPEDLESCHVRDGVWRKGSSAGSISAGKLRQILEQDLPAEYIYIYKGYYKDTLSTIPEKTKFAMLLMDCCLYQSHWEVLYHLFAHEMVSEGAIILFSDWNANKASPIFGSRKAWQIALTKFNIVYSDAGRYCWGGQRFIIHSYAKCQ